MKTKYKIVKCEEKHKDPWFEVHEYKKGFFSQKFKWKTMVFRPYLLPFDTSKYEYFTHSRRHLPSIHRFETQEQAKQALEIYLSDTEVTTVTELEY